MNFQTKIKNFIEQKLKKVFRIKNGIVYKNSTSKNAIGANYSAEFNTETKKKVQKIEAEVKTIIKSYFKNPEGLIKFLNNYKINVYRIKNADKILSSIYEEEGFITPQKGIKAFLLNNLVNFSRKNPFSLMFKSKPMFIFDTQNVEIYTVARALYKYFGYREKLSGYEPRAQEVYKISKHRKENMFKGFSPEDILACREAMARDMESINFTLSLSVEFDTSKHASKKISGGGANI